MTGKQLIAFLGFGLLVIVTGSLIIHFFGPRPMVYAMVKLEGENVHVTNLDKDAWPNSRIVLNNKTGPQIYAGPFLPNETRVFPLTDFVPQLGQPPFKATRENVTLVIIGAKGFSPIGVVIACSALAGVQNRSAGS